MISKKVFKIFYIEYSRNKFYEKKWFKVFRKSNFFLFFDREFYADQKCSGRLFSILSIFWVVKILVRMIKKIIFFEKVFIMFNIVYSHRIWFILSKEVFRTIEIKLVVRRRYCIVKSKNLWVSNLFVAMIKLLNSGSYRETPFSEYIVLLK